MPIYGYRCEQCGHELEVLQSFSEEPLKVCPQCMGPLRKMIYPAGIIFKGSGYYTTDYKGAGKASSTSDGGSSSSDGGSSSEGGGGSSESRGDSAKSDSKPAKDAPAKPAKAAKPAAD